MSIFSCFCITYIFRIFRTFDVSTRMFRNNLLLDTLAFINFFSFAIASIFILLYIIFIFMMIIKKVFSNAKEVSKCSENTLMLILLKRNAMRIYTLFFSSLFKKHIFNCSIILSRYFASVLNFKIIFWFVFWSF